MQWAEVTVLTASEAVEAVTAILERYGSNGVVLEDSGDLTRTFVDRYGEIYGLSPEDYPETGVRVKGYIALELWSDELVSQITTDIRDLAHLGIDPGAGHVTHRIADEEEWANEWKKYYHPVRVTDRLTIKPSWEEYEPAAGELIIELDPGMAFGTGTHPTTNLCLKVVESVLREGDTMVDVGCGTAILSIAAAKLGAGAVLALDLDPVAVGVAQENVAMNGVQEVVTVRANDLLKGVEDTYDVVVANILAEIILLMIDSAKQVLKPSGTFITSGIIKDKADTVQNALEQAGFAVQEKIQDGDWVALVAKHAEV